MVIQGPGPEQQAHIKAQWSTILHDLAARGVTDDDVEGLAVDGDIDTEKEPPIQGWEFTVTFKSGTSWVYRLDNADNAQLLRMDGQAMLGQAMLGNEKAP
jgi:hypothetical protein